MSIFTGNTPPAFVAADAIWLSTALKDISPAPQPSMRKKILVRDQSYETSYIQEPSVWFANGLWHCIYAAGSVVGYASAPSPTGPWTKNPTAVLGGGINGLSGAPQHQNVYLEGSTLYMTFIDSNANTRFSQATADVSNPTVWAVNAFSFDPGSQYRSGGLGNTWTVKVGSLYYLFFEASFGSMGWQIGLATGSSPNGTFTVKQFPLVDLASVKGMYGDVFGPAFFPCGNMWAGYENNEFVMYFGALGLSGALNDIYMMTSPDGLTWSSPNNNYPVLRRNAAEEVDQAVDPTLAKADDGSWWMFYSQMDNVTQVGSIATVPMSPAMMMWDGNKYSKVGTFGEQFAMRDWILTPVFTSSTYTARNGEKARADTTSGNITVTLPRAARGARCSVANVGPTGGANTVTATPNASDSVSNTNSALTVGQVAVFECHVANRWSRIG